MPHDSFCSRHAMVPITVSLAEGEALTFVLTAIQWSVVVGLPWETVKKRRQRGDAWTSALQPGRRKRTFNRRKW